MTSRSWISRSPSRACASGSTQSITGLNVPCVIIAMDVLILGCGVAGGTVALCLADAGRPVTLVTRAADPHDSNTNLAQGGIIYQGQEDSPALLVADIVRAGAGHTSRQAATILAAEGPGLVERILLERLGVAFDRVSDGTFALALV